MDDNGIDAEVVFDGPVAAPITKGQQLGELVITLEGLPETRLPLVADRDVAKAGSPCGCAQRPMCFGPNSPRSRTPPSDDAGIDRPDGWHVSSPLKASTGRASPPSRAALPTCCAAHGTD